LRLKKVVLFFVLASFIFVASFVAGKRAKEKKVERSIDSEQVAAHFSPAPFVLKNHPFVVVVYGVNNGAYIGKTLNSIFSQNYDNFRLIYIDDASDDGSFDLVQDLIFDSPCFSQATLVKNENRMGFLGNLYRASQACEDNEIIIVLQQGDSLSHEWVLQRLNSYYANPDLWLTYGQYADFPTFELGACSDYKGLNFRESPFVASHLQTFYAGLFKKIRREDFMTHGSFFSYKEDLAFMIPMLEMAQEHYLFIKEILYIKRGKMDECDDLEEVDAEKAIRRLDPYLPLKAHEVAFRTCGK